MAIRMFLNGLFLSYLPQQKMTKKMRSVFYLNLLELISWVQPLNETGYSQVRFAAPDLFLRCGSEGKSRLRSCLYTIKHDGAELQNGEIV